VIIVPGRKKGDDISESVWIIIEMET